MLIDEACFKVSMARMDHTISSNHKPGKIFVFWSADSNMAFCGHRFTFEKHSHKFINKRKSSSWENLASGIPDFAHHQLFMNWALGNFRWVTKSNVITFQFMHLWFTLKSKTVNAKGYGGRELHNTSETMLFYYFYFFEVGSIWSETVFCFCMHSRFQTSHFASLLSLVGHELRLKSWTHFLQP